MERHGVGRERSGNVTSPGSAHTIVSDLSIFVSFPQHARSLSLAVLLLSNEFRTIFFLSFFSYFPSLFLFLIYFFFFLKDNIHRRVPTAPARSLLFIADTMESLISNKFIRTHANAHMRGGAHTARARAPASTHTRARGKGER